MTGWTLAGAVLVLAGIAGVLEELPRLRQSVASGKLGWTKVREVAKVATPQSEEKRIAEAERSSSRKLEKTVRETRKRAHRAPQATGRSLLDLAASSLDPLPTDAPTMVNTKYTSEQYARYEDLLETDRLDGYRVLRSEEARGPIPIERFRAPVLGLELVRMADRVESIDQIGHRLAAQVRVAHQVDQGVVTPLPVRPVGRVDEVRGLGAGREDVVLRVARRMVSPDWRPADCRMRDRK